MADREDWGLWLLLVGMGLGMLLMVFVVGFDGTAFYQKYIAPTASEAMPPLGFVLDGAILLSFAMAVAGIACFGWGPSVIETPAVARPSRDRARVEAPRQREERHRPKPGQPSAPHGST